MKKLFRLLCPLLSAAMLLSCGASVGEEQSTTAPDTTAAPAAPAADMTREWVFIRSDESAEHLQTIQMLRAAFKELFGYEPGIKTDFLTPKQSPGEYEILVGTTTRESAAETYRNIPSGGYTYSVLSENVIVIAGRTVLDTRHAAEQFLRDCFGYTEPGTGTAAPVTIGTSFTGKYEAPFDNPVVDGLADPDVLYYDGVYYLYGTSSRLSQGYEVFTSTDLKTWENRGICLDQAWGFTRWYWAPDIEEHNGKFYMLASVDEHLGLCVADSPLGPFVPQERYLFANSIDGHIFFDGDDMYIYYVSWRADHPYGIWGCKMNLDTLTPDLSTEKLLLQATEPYEKQKSGVVEGPYMLVKDGKYYLTYSGSNYESQKYCVCYAVSDSPLGEYKKYRNNPIMIGDGVRVFGAGHHCVITRPDGQMVIVYHTHNNANSIHPRNVSMDYIYFRDTADGPVLYCDGPNR